MGDAAERVRIYSHHDHEAMQALPQLNSTMYDKTSPRLLNMSFSQGPRVLEERREPRTFLRKKFEIRVGEGRLQFTLRDVSAMYCMYHIVKNPVQNPYHNTSRDLKSQY